MVFLFSLIASGWALELDRLDLSAMADAIVPQLEEATGRPFLQVPRIEVVSREDLYHRVLMGQLATRELMGLGPFGPAELQTWMDLTSNAIGFYTYADRQIFLVTSGAEELYENFIVPEDLERPLIECVLAHELVHALQHQYQPLPDITQADQETVARMLREGHANLISRTVCTDEVVQRFFRFNDGLDILAVQGVGQENSFLYGYGERYLELLVSLHGPEAGWCALSQPPPSREAIAAAVDPLLLQGWRGTGVLDDAARRLMWPGAKGRVQPVSPAEVLQRQLGPEGVTALHSTQAGLTFNLDSDTKSLAIMAFAFSDPQEAREQFEARRRNLETAREAGEELFFFGPVGAYSSRYKVKSSRDLEAEAEGSFETRIQIDNDREYLETWAVRGGLLLLAAATGTDLKPQDLSEALTLVLAQDLPTAPPSSPTPGALGLAPPTEAPAPRPSWEYPFVQVLRDISAEQWETCISGVESMIPNAPEAERDFLAKLGWTCSLSNEDADAASRFLTAMEDLSALDPELVIGHAALYLQQERWQDCLDHLVRVEALGLVLPVAAQDLKIACLIETGRLSQAAAAARRQDGTPQMRLHVSYALLQAQRFQQAQPILREACPQVTGEDQEKCRRLMDQLTPRSR